MLDEAKVFEYLDNLKESGTMNMHSAAPIIAEAFGISIHLAREVLLKWMKNFNKE